MLSFYPPEKKHEGMTMEVTEPAVERLRDHNQASGSMIPIACNAGLLNR
jgi:hypothetical protein